MTKPNLSVRISGVYSLVGSASQRRRATSQKEGMGLEYSDITPNTNTRKFQETQHPEDAPFVADVVRSKHRGALVTDQKISMPSNRSLIFHAVVSIAHQFSYKD